MISSSRQGFTLIETVVVVAFSIVMLLAVTTLVYNFNKISSENQTASGSSGSARTFMREAESLISQADAVLATHAFAASTRSSSSTSLILEIPSVDSSGVVIPAAFDYAALYIVGTNAYRLLETNSLSKRPAGTKLLSTTVNSLIFSYDNADFTAVSMVTIDVQTRTAVKQDILTDHLHEQLRLRNQ